MSVALAGCAVGPSSVEDAGGPVASDATVRLVLEVETPEWEGEMLYVALYQDADRWLDPEGWILGQTVPVTAPVTTVVFDTVPAWPTAVSAFIDVEPDETFTRNAFGLPTEPWGFSNDLSVLFSRPAFQAATVDLAPPSQVVRFAMGRSLDRSGIRRARHETAVVADP